MKNKQLIWPFGLYLFIFAGVATYRPYMVLYYQPLLTVAGVIYADEQAPRGFRTTAQGLFNVSYGAIGAAVGGFAGGLLFESLGAKGMYLVFSLFVTVVLVLVSVVRRSLPITTGNLPLSPSDKEVVLINEITLHPIKK